MTTTPSWGTIQTWVSLLSTGLNSLANNTGVISAAVTSNTYKYMDVSVSLASLTPGTNGYIQVYVLPQLDSTSYADCTTSIPAGTQFALPPIELASGASAKFSGLSGVRAPNGNFKLAIFNYSGVSFAASGNVLGYRFYNDLLT